jgi:hypothetical protein
MTSMETQLKMHVIDKITLVQMFLTSKLRGLETFIVDVVRSLGRRLMALEVKPTQNSIVINNRVEMTLGEDQDAEVEGRPLKLQNKLEEFNADAFDEQLLDRQGMETFVSS